MFKEIGLFIKAERQRRGWDQSQLIQRLGGGVRQQAVSGWERGASRPKPEMISRLAQLFDLDRESLMNKAGYTSDKIQDQIKQPVRPLSLTLPLDKLTPADFEKFSVSLLSYRYPNVFISLYGENGYKQFGIDAVGRKGQKSEILVQCKRERQFGPAKVVEAVGLVGGKAEKKLIFLTRVASPKTREKIAEYKDWELWDVNDISEAVRKINLEDAVRLVDTYFPGWREAFLGVSLPGPWLKTDEYYQQFRDDRLFNHSWDLVGRLETLKSLEAFLTGSGNVGLLLGNAGAGKTRLLKSLASLAEGEGYTVRFLPVSHEVRTENFELFSKDGKLLVIVDDSHERTDLELLIRGILGRNPVAKVLFSLRPYGKSLLADALSRNGLHPSEYLEWGLKELSLEDVERLAQEVLGKGFSNIVAEQLAAVSQDCPFITVVAGGLIKRGDLDPGRLLASKSIRTEVQRLFRHFMVAELNRGDGNQVLSAISLLQPVLVKKPAFQMALEKLVGVSLNNILPHINALEDAGIVLRRGQSLRIVPDLLGDSILTEACFDDRTGLSLGYIERAGRELDGAPLEHAFTNATRVDWQIRQNGEGSSLVDFLWDEVENEFRKTDITGRSDLLVLIQKVAYFQPARALVLAKWAMENPTNRVKKFPKGFDPKYKPTYQNVLHELAPVLKRVAYNTEFLPESLDLLWELAQGDKRRANSYPDHALRALGELADYDYGKPLEFNQIVIDAAKRWLKTLGENWQISPLDVLDHLLATELVDSRSDSLKITFRSMSISPEKVQGLRGQIIGVVLDELKFADIRRAVRAAKSLGTSISRPQGMYGRLVTEKEEKIWDTYFAEILKQLGKVVKESQLDPVILIELRLSLNWHSRYSKTETGKIAQMVLKKLPVTLEYQISEALFDGHGRLFDHVDSFEKAEAKQIAARQKAIDQLLSQFDDNQLLVLLGKRLSIQNEAFGDSKGSPGPFFWALMKSKPEIGVPIIEEVISNPFSPFEKVLPVVISCLAESIPSEAVELANRLIATNNTAVIHGVAQAFGWNRGARHSLISGEIGLLKGFATSEDPQVRGAAVRAAAVLSETNKSVALDLVSSIKFSDSTAVSEELFFIFGRHGTVKIEDLSKEQREHIWSGLLECDSLDEPSILDFIKDVAMTEPELVLELLQKRVQLVENYPVRYGMKSDFHAIPYSWRSEIVSDPNPQRQQLLRRTLDWIAEKPRSWQRSMMGAKIFKMLANSFDNGVLEIIAEALSSGSEAKVMAAGVTLSEMPKSLIWNDVVFVSNALTAAKNQSVDSLRVVSGAFHDAILSGGRHGTPGEPFPEDLEQRDFAARIAMTLTPGSEPEKFYRSLEQSAVESIRWHAQDDEKLMDNREW